MGNLVPKSLAALFSKPRSMRILMLGLDAAGKTTVLYKLAAGKYSDIVTTIPTIGFNVETFNIKGTVITAWDVGGRDKIRPLWRHYYQDTDAVVFIVDSNDTDRLDIAKEELWRQWNEEELEGKPLLVLCNKQDLPRAVTPDVITEKLSLKESRGRNWRAFSCVATKGEGLFEGLDWLCGAVHGKQGVPGHGNEGVPEVEASPKKQRQLQDESVSVVHSAKNPVDIKNTFPPLRGSDSDGDTVESALDLPLGYEPADPNGPTLSRFDTIKHGTECPFAKSAKLWGSPAVAAGSNLEDQAEQNVNPLSNFVELSEKGEKLDGYCVELDDPSAREGGPAEFGECIRRFLVALSDLDPSGERVMKNVKHVGSRGWRFRFAGADFFVTSFAPCYPATSSRYGFGTGRAFLLLQPERSFARKDLVFDTAITEWENPTTVRDKTRVAFRNAGRGYHIPKSTRYPPAEHIVKPLRDDGVGVVRWWLGIFDARTDAERSQ